MLVSSYITTSDTQYNYYASHSTMCILVTTGGLMLLSRVMVLVPEVALVSACI